MPVSYKRHSPVFIPFTITLTVESGKAEADLVKLQAADLLRVCKNWNIQSSDLLHIFLTAIVKNQI